MKKETPLLSVVVLSYNNSKYIIDCLESIRRQDICSYEVIVVDDGSTDDTVSKLKNYSDQYPEFRYIVKENEGGAIASSVGLKECQGTYCAIVDSDDVVAEGAYKKLISFIDENNLDFAIGRPLRLLEGVRLNTLLNANENNLFYKTRVCVTNEEKAEVSKQPYYWNAIYRRSFIAENDIRMPDGLLIADRIFLYKAILRAERIGIIEDVVYYWRRKQNDDNLSLMDKTMDDSMISSRFESFSAQINLLNDEKKNNSELSERINANSIERLFYPLFDLELPVKERKKLFDRYQEYIHNNKCFFDDIRTNIFVKKSIIDIIKIIESGRFYNLRFDIWYSTIKKRHILSSSDEDCVLRIKGFKKTEGKIFLDLDIKNLEIIKFVAANRLFEYSETTLDVENQNNINITDLNAGTYLLTVVARNKKNGTFSLVKMQKNPAINNESKRRMFFNDKEYRIGLDNAILEVYTPNQFTLIQNEKDILVQANKPESLDDLFFYNGKNNQKIGIEKVKKNIYRICDKNLLSGSNYLIHKGQSGNYGYLRKEELTNHSLTDFRSVIAKNRIQINIKGEKKLSVDMRNNIRDGNAEKIIALIKEKPEESIKLLKQYETSYSETKELKKKLSRRRYNQLVKLNKGTIFIKGVLELSIKANDAKKRRKQASLWLMYWKNTIKHKNDDVWVFSGFRGKGYLDNTKYFFEYVLKNHPEIRAYWITKDNEVYSQLMEEGKPVLKMGTKQCMDIVSTAAVGVSDHYRMSDFDIPSGLNDGLKIVQLWHGVSLKDFKGLLEKTTIKGIKYDHSIFDAKGRVQNKLKYLRIAPKSELFERYLLFMCPGDEQRQKVVKDAHIPYDACFICGFPRNYYLHTEETDKETYRVLYAPTYRWDQEAENRMIDLLVDSAKKINNCMEKIGGTFTVRLHPHTWRNHSGKLTEIAEKYNNIYIDRDKDIYKSIGKYSMIISDYSSIAMDFVLMDKPCVFLAFDKDDFIRTEGGFSMDYDEYSPGPKTKNWEETLEAICNYQKHPNKDSEWRATVRNVFYDMSVNDENNSERIVEEIKKRIKR